MTVAPFARMMTGDESGANPIRLARTRYEPAAGACNTYVPASPVMVPATIAPSVSTRAIVVSPEPRPLSSRAVPWIVCAAVADRAEHAATTATQIAHLTRNA